MADVNDNNDLGILHRSVRWLGRALLARSLFFLASAIIGGIGTYTYVSYADIADRLNERVPLFENERAEWITALSIIVANANPNSDDPRLPTVHDVSVIRNSTTNLINQLNAVPTPTRNIEVSASEFRSSLTNVILALSRYDRSAEAATRIVEAAQLASEQGETHRQSIERYLGSTVQRFLGTVF